jgi:hypothetical protein
VTFAGSGGDLALNNLAGFAAAISGFARTDELDLGGFAFSSSAIVTFAEAATKTSGTLTVVDGTQQASLTLLGNYTQDTFSLMTDNQGGSFVHVSLTPKNM